MRFFDILFGKKKPPAMNSVTIDFREDCFILNGQVFPFPPSLSELKQVLGEPRTTDLAIDSFYTKERLEYLRKYHNISSETFTPERHYWDDPGIMVSTYDHETTICLTVYLRKSKYPVSMPRNPFRGNLLIHGEPWQKCVLIQGRVRSVIPLGKIHLSIIHYGRANTENTVKHIELSLNHMGK